MALGCLGGLGRLPGARAERIDLAERCDDVVDGDLPVMGLQRILAFKGGAGLERARIDGALMAVHDYNFRLWCVLRPEPNARPLLLRTWCSNTAEAWIAETN